jgi:signal peptidase II
VVDMFYFPIIQTTLPEWLPFWGGNDFIFFRPVFNIADSSITVGIFSILLFYRKQFNSLDKEIKESDEVSSVPDEITEEPLNKPE